MPARRWERPAPLTRLSATSLQRTVRAVCRAMRDPLNVLQLQLHLLEHGLEERDGMREQVHRLEDIVSVFFELSQPFRLRRELLDPAPLLDGLARLPGVRVERPRALPELTGDRAYLLRALQHAVLRLNRLGAVSISVRASNASSPDRLLIEIQEVGDESVENLVATPSEAALRTTIVEQIVRAHGGSVEVSSPEIGAGCMRITFPLPTRPWGRHARENQRTPRR